MTSTCNPTIDPTATELTGSVARIRWRSAVDATVILDMDDGSCVITADRTGTLSPGVTYRFYGTWREHARHGWQFHAPAGLRTAGAGKAGVVRYLADLCPGIGRTKAARLYDTLGPLTVELMRTNPEKVAATGILTDGQALEAGELLRRFEAHEHVTVDLWTLFDGTHLPARFLIPLCLSRWGATAADVIRRNPYRLLLDRLPGCGFLRCDRLYLHLGYDPHRLKRQALCLWHQIDSDNTGDTWLPVEELDRRLRETIGGPARPVEALKVGLRAKVLAGWRDAGGQLWITTAARADAERRVAENVVRLIQGVVS